MNPDVAAVFDAAPPRVTSKLLELRKLILDTAAATDGVGELEETLKWGEPAYLTSQTRSGTTLRIGWKPSAPDEYSLNVHCQTRLIERFRDRFHWELKFDGNRRVVFQIAEPLSRGVVSECIAEALTYHLKKRR